jgi:hypothetical protein
MKVYELFVVGCLLVVPSIVISCGPNFDSLDLSGCMKGCNDTARKCLGDQEIKIVACPTDDKLCQFRAVKDTELCLTTCLDCTAECVKILEQQIKE